MLEQLLTPEFPADSEETLSKFPQTCWLKTTDTAFSYHSGGQNSKTKVPVRRATLPLEAAGEHASLPVPARLLPAVLGLSRLVAASRHLCLRLGVGFSSVCLPVLSPF